MSSPNGTAVDGTATGMQHGNHHLLPNIKLSEIHTQFVLTLVIGIFTTIIVVTRMWVRKSLIGKVEADDWVLGISWIVLVGYTVVQIISVQYAYQIDEDIEAGQRDAHEITIPYMTWDYVLTILYYCCAFITKLSILTLYLRLCRKDSQLRYTTTGVYLHRLTWMTIVLIALVFIPSVVVTIFQCNPISHIWMLNRNDKNAGCIHREDFYIATSVLHIACDTFISLLPIPLVMKINGPLLYRVGLASILMLGLSATGACCGRLAVLLKANQPDSIYYVYAVSINTWSYAEICLGIVGASVPALKPLFRRFCRLLVRHGWTYPNCTGTGDLSTNEDDQPSRVAEQTNRRRIDRMQVIDAQNPQASQAESERRKGSFVKNFFEKRRNSAAAKESLTSRGSSAGWMSRRSSVASAGRTRNGPTSPVVLMSLEKGAPQPPPPPLLPTIPSEVSVPLPVKVRDSPNVV